jgi:endonuclease YncB( thermonuclease family)
MFTRSRFRHTGGCWFFCFSLLFLCLSLLFLAAPMPPVFAQDSSAGSSAHCRLGTVATGVVEKIIDGRTFIIADGSEVRLAAIEVPANANDAKLTLEDLVHGKKIEMRSASATPDRYGRRVAQVFLADGNTSTWAQGELIARGHARVSARVGNAACAEELLRRERAARQAKLGLWGDPYYVIQRADNPAAVLAERGRFTIVEGDVVSVRESGGTIYVNFGRRWSEDFTVTIAKRNEPILAAGGLVPKTLAGRRVRVRGWVEERGGPWIEVTRPEQIELVERD